MRCHSLRFGAEEELGALVRRGQLLRTDGDAFEVDVFVYRALRGPCAGLVRKAKAARAKFAAAKRPQPAATKPDKKAKKPKKK